MTMLTVRNLDPGVKDRLRKRAAEHGRSMEAEVREILAAAVAPEDDMIGVFLDVFRRPHLDVAFPRAKDMARYPEFD